MYMLITPCNKPITTEMAFRMNMGRRRREGVEKKNRAITMGMKQADQVVPTMRRVSKGSITATPLVPRGGGG